AMSSPSSQLWHRLCHHLFPSSTYHYNSGGEPEAIPDLSWDDLRAFHAAHYHPSNAMFLTFGNIPAAEHQARFQALALQHFRRDERVIAVAPEQRYATPLRVSEPYPAEADDTPKTHVVSAWLLGESTDLQQALEIQLLANLL